MIHTDSKKHALQKPLMFGVFIVLLSIAAVFFAAAFTNADVVYAAESGEIHYEIDHVPAETAEIIVPNGAATIKPGESIRLGVILTPYYCNTQTILYTVTKGGVFASVDGDGKLSVVRNAPVGAQITVVAAADNISSAPVTFTVEKLPIESITIGAGGQAVINDGGTLQLEFNAFPAYASNANKITFSVIEGAEYASVNNKGKITVKNNSQPPEQKL
jgi:hypothetical protein